MLACMDKYKITHNKNLQLFDLCDFGLSLVQSKIERENPNASLETIHEKFKEFYRGRATGLSKNIVDLAEQFRHKLEGRIS